MRKGYPLLLIFLASFVIYLSGCSNPSGGGVSTGWQITTVDNTAANVGEFTSLALDASGNPHISYYDRTNGYIKYASFNGSSWSIVIVDNVAISEKGYTSIALDASGNPHICYYNGINDELRYVSWEGSSWNMITIESVGSNGGYTSLALGSDNKPRVSYYNSNAGKVTYASLEGSSWNIASIESCGSGWTSLALDTNGNPYISYYGSLASMKYASWEAASSTWKIGMVDEGGVSKDRGNYSSIALNSSGFPGISYWDQVSFEALKYAEWTGATWEIEVLESSGPSAQLTTSLAFTASDEPRITYYKDNSQALRYASKTGLTWEYTTVDGGGAAAGVGGQYSSLVLDASGNPHISYYFSNDGSLRYARWVPLSP
ncbi:hypothetical protein ACFLZ2_01795 [Candidatus Margulisiibacteriota bacterium]